MIFVDTNILVRLITNDVPELRDKAQQLIEAVSTKDLFVPDIVLTELFFVLEKNRSYFMKRSQVCEAVNDLLSQPQFFCSTEANLAIIIAARTPKLDFTDCLLAIYASKPDRLMTFDKDLVKTLATLTG